MVRIITLSFLWFVHPDIRSDFVGVKPSASREEIVKAVRKKSKLIHPDKAKQSFVASKAKPTNKSTSKKKPGVHVSRAPKEKEIQDAVKKATERFARLGVIADILKGADRERYDYFLSNGFPKWRGTGYYYARFRPGLGSVLIGLFVLGGGLAHYGALVLSWKRQKDFVDRYIRHARRTAWGDEMGIRGIPGIDSAAIVSPSAAASGQEEGTVGLNRRQKRMQERESRKDKDKKNIKSLRRSGTSTPLDTEPTSSPQGERKRVQAENGKVLLVDSVGNVFLEEENEDGVKGEYLLDPDEIQKPSFKQTILFQLPIWIYTVVRKRLLGQSTSSDDEELLYESDSSDAEESTKAIAAAKSSANGSARRREKRNGKA